jgi:hypothetical protein
LLFVQGGGQSITGFLLYLLQGNNFEGITLRLCSTNFIF